MQRLYFSFLCALVLSTCLYSQSFGSFKPDKATEDSVFYSHAHSSGPGMSGGYDFMLPEALKQAELLLTQWSFVVGNSDPNGHGQVSSVSSFRLQSANSNAHAGFTLQSSRYNNNRRLLFSSSSKNYDIPLGFAVGEELHSSLFFDRENSRFRFILTREGRMFFDSQWQQCNIFVPGKLRYYQQANSNDGLNNQLQKLSFEALQVKQLPELLAKLKFTGASPCSTMPRKYAKVNQDMYNTSFANLTTSNNGDRIGLLNEEEADKHVKWLHELGFTGALYNGRHFRMSYVEEFPSIREAGKILLDACRKYGIQSIEHHEPTIVGYRGYPLMLNNLDWSQSDIRSGENSFWFCPVNPGFQQACIDYLYRYHESALASGYMIDELSRANRNACYCKACREGFKKESGMEPPSWTNHNAPSSAQSKYKDYSDKQITNMRSRMLEALQQIKEDTFIMTYCSDYGDPNASIEDLTLDAADYSAFVGWENMIYDPLNSWTSMMRCFKMRNSYGDFYDIPVWSLNREQVVRESHYLAWAMSQGTRHSIWWGSRLPLKTAEDQDYFLRYHKWADTMPHQYARTLTNVGVLLSYQSKKITSDRNHFWYDYCGVVDTLVRESKQFDSLLDGDLFYPDRLGKYKTLLLVSQANLSDQQCEVLSDWVEAGGTAVLTRNSSLFDEAGNRRPDFQLAEKLNVSSQGGILRNLQVKSYNQALQGGFNLPAYFQVELLQPEKSRLLASAVDENGVELPLVVESSWGKGRFIYVASGLGETVYEMEMRNGRSYNYKPNPPLQNFISDLYDYASQEQIVSFKAPEKVIAIVNQLQDGSGSIYAQLYNFTGQSIKQGEKRSYGVPEKMLFPEIKQDLVLQIMRPCADTAVLSTPEREGRQTIKGSPLAGGGTRFVIPGSLLGAFAQLKIEAQSYADQKILQPPIEVPRDIVPFSKSPAEVSTEEYYHQPKLEVQLCEPSQDEVLLRVNGQPLIVSDAFEATQTEISPIMLSEALDSGISQRLGFKGEGLSGELAAGELFGGDLNFVREVAWHGQEKAEISLSAILHPKKYDFGHFGYAIRIPVELLKGATAAYTLGRHRSQFAPRSYKITGEEPEGQMIIGHLRHVQFSGGKIDFMINFAPDGIWGIFIEGLVSQYKAHMRREGKHYVFYIVQNSGVKFGTKNATKVVIRPGLHNYLDYHPYNTLSYQINRPVSTRLQFTDSSPATGFVNRNMPGHDLEFTAVNPGNWSDSQAVRLVSDTVPSQEPLFHAGISGEGSNTLTLEHQNGIVLLNLAMKGIDGDLRGTINSGGKDFAFELAQGERDTLVIPTWVKDGKIALRFSGKWNISAIIIQPLMSDAEDYLFSRSWWNCGIAPQLIPEMKQSKEVWRYVSDLPYRRAKWNW
ncbi:MAG: hypothetical protein GX901_04810 [Lentisphaerae bacterium]|nr:hypothetical protein [Lentisphaerota bacterium]